MAGKNTITIDKHVGPINIVEKLRKNSSCIGKVVNELAKEICDASNNVIENTIEFDIEAKITHNDLGKYKHLIEDYSLYKSKLDLVYKSISLYKPDTKYKIYRTINSFYRQLKGELMKSYQTDNENLSEIEIIRIHSDDIIENVINKLDSLITDSDVEDVNIDVEDIQFSLELIVGDAFVECKILENPNNGSNY